MNIHHLKISLWVPDGEGAIIGHGIEQIMPVRTDAGMAYGAFCVLRQCRRRPDDSIHLVSYSARFLIEGDTAQAILQLLDIPRQENAVRHTVVDIFSIGREGGEGLELQGVAEQGRADDGIVL